MKDIIEEKVKEVMYGADIDFSMSLQDDSVTYPKSYQLYGKIREALTSIAKTAEERGMLIGDEIDALVATFELATDEEKKFMEMGMLAYRQAVMDKFQPTESNNT